MKCMGAVESDSVKSARKAKDKLHKACERASETGELTLHGRRQEQTSLGARPSKNRKGGSGTSAGVEVYTAEC